MANKSLEKLIFIPDYIIGKWALPITCFFIGFLFIATGIDNTEFVYKVAFMQTGILSIGGAFWITSQRVKQIEFDNQITVSFQWHKVSYNYDELIDFELHNRMVKIGNKIILLQFILNFNDLEKIIERLYKNKFIRTSQFNGELKHYYKEISLMGFLASVLIVLGTLSLNFLLPASDNIQGKVFALLLLPYALWIAYWIVRINKKEHK